MYTHTCAYVYMADSQCQTEPNRNDDFSKKSGTETNPTESVPS